MFFDTFWALLFGFALSGVIQALVTRKQMSSILGDHKPATILRSSFFGIVSSSCSYAASALAHSIYKKGADFTASMVFMFASTNLVVELGIVLWLLIGWQFAFAEFVGGAIMITLLSLVLPRLISPSDLIDQGGGNGSQQRDEKAQSTQDQATQDLSAHDNQDSDDQVTEQLSSDSGRKLLPLFDISNSQAMTSSQVMEMTSVDFSSRSSALQSWRSKASASAGFTVGDLTMLRIELVIGFIVAGLATSLVPFSFWRALFLSGHGFWSALENAIIGPFLAFISFVCSVGNVPLAAALWSAGITFGGVIAFIFADLISFPLVMIYKKYYGVKFSIKLMAIFWAIMSISGLASEGIFYLLKAIPTRSSMAMSKSHFGFNATTILNGLALLLLMAIFYFYKNPVQDGESDFAQDPICGMQVRKSDAPASYVRGGVTYYFCMQGCKDAFIKSTSV